ncbi:MAG TPA: pirin family protein [Alphaproteobacteria bacterium]|nr:pirin family protein [Alphaproteobacteria bacterium]
MIEITPFEKLGRFRNDWLNAHYHFSFANYYNPARMGFGPLVVWNDDEIRAHSGFDPHPHRDMEIITYVRQGAITHRDSLGNEGRTEAGDVQVMSAGSGIVHAEYNLEDEETRLFQIWLQPTETGLPPRWDAAKFPRGERAGRLVPLASGEAGIEALTIHQDATLYGATLPAGAEIAHVLRPGRRVYLVPASGRITVNGEAAAARAGVKLEAAQEIRVAAEEDTELLLFDLP